MSDPIDMTTNENAGRVSRLTRSYVEEHMVPDRSELVTRINGRTRDEIFCAIVEHLHWRFAENRADDIVRGNEKADGAYGRQPLEAIACGEAGDAIKLQVVQEDLEVIAIELLGLLWRLEDAGVIQRTETIVEVANSGTVVVAKCECEWVDELWHDRIVAIECSGHYWTTDLIGSMVMGIDGDKGLLSGPSINDFEQFVSEHNWKDPRAMSRLAADLQYINEQGRS